MPVQGILPQDTLTALLTFKRFPHLHLTVAGSPMAAPVGPLSGPVVMAFEWFVVVASCLGLHNFFIDPLNTDASFSSSHFRRVSGFCLLTVPNILRYILEGVFYIDNLVC